MQQRRNNVQRASENEGGDLLMDPDDIKNKWKGHIEVLYNKDGKPSDLPVEEKS